ncbi:hypothetical protein L226DRAFT_614298 [Lentinus tigrinus ALCF2SS1-7]|uniref:Uncharacterized protein n=1 Tax=Lentinus tigrinus ALCF2SS1-6 TaxID=1328759 RepID=A0A5C2S5E5_9APHY|nr:hypothetical protein L227DRAFT_654307 [Lentinus tigrinus ALCF2SS1-6]RPD73429.1 hypothetical protein L226DRAFT_614298 [Lentinus tigrinus ALCF2SS1-7]
MGKKAKTDNNAAKSYPDPPPTVVNDENDGAVVVEASQNKQRTKQQKSNGSKSTVPLSLQDAGVPLTSISCWGCRLSDIQTPAPVAYASPVGPEDTSRRSRRADRRAAHTTTVDTSHPSHQSPELCVRGGTVGSHGGGTAGSSRRPTSSPHSYPNHYDRISATTYSSQPQLETHVWRQGYGPQSMTADYPSSSASTFNGRAPHHTSHTFLRPSVPTPNPGEGMCKFSPSVNDISSYRVVSGLPTPPPVPSHPPMHMRRNGTTTARLSGSGHSQRYRPYYRPFAGHEPRVATLSLPGPSLASEVRPTHPVHVGPPPLPQSVPPPEDWRIASTSGHGYLSHLDPPLLQTSVRLGPAMDRNYAETVRSGSTSDATPMPSRVPNHFGDVFTTAD